jgi:hypothetical protein
MAQKVKTTPAAKAAPVTVAGKASVNKKAPAKAAAPAVKETASAHAQGIAVDAAFIRANYKTYKAAWDKLLTAEEKAIATEHEVDTDQMKANMLVARLEMGKLSAHQF